MPTRLMTTSLPRKSSLNCASSYTSQFCNVSPGSTSKCLCCSRSRDKTVTRRPSLIKRATKRVPRKPVPPRTAMDCGRIGSANLNEPHVEDQDVGVLRRFLETLVVRNRRAAHAHDHIVGAQAILRRRAAFLDRF